MPRHEGDKRLESMGANRSECSSIPLFNYYEELLRNIKEVNLWSFEYVATTFLRLLKMRKSCTDGRVTRKAESELINMVEQITKLYRCTYKDRYERIIKYYRDLSRALCSLGYKVRDVKIRLAGRGSIGVSSGLGKLLFEWGISFDPYLNIPYIPASSIKGAVRAAYIKLCIRERGDTKYCKDKADDLFGSASKGAGLIMFTDAYPIGCDGKYLVIPDVMTPHYNDPSLKFEKDARPNPILHISLNDGAMFEFIMFHSESKGNRKVSYDEDLINDPEDIKGLNDLRLVDKALLLALGLGIGAKTLTGYTHFKLLSYHKLC